MKLFMSKRLPICDKIIAPGSVVRLSNRLLFHYMNTLLLCQFIIIFKITIKNLVKIDKKIELHPLSEKAYNKIYHLLL